MKPEEQRIAIAEACGWKQHPFNKYYGSIGGKAGKGVHSVLWPNGLPDYLNDLNAMAEAEAVLFNTMGIHFSDGYYENHLPGVVGGSKGCWMVISATASQRAEAFLRTLNLYTESK